MNEGLLSWMIYLQGTQSPTLIAWLVFLYSQPCLCLPGVPALLELWGGQPLPETDVSPDPRSRGQRPALGKATCVLLRAMVGLCFLSVPPPDL